MARTTTEHTIVIQSAKYHGVTRDEDVGTGSKFYPGHVIEKRANGVQLHSTAGGHWQRLLVLEDQTIDTDTYAGSSTLQSAYAKGETIYIARLQPGDIVQARLKQSESATDGVTLLASDGAGHVQAAGSAGVNAGTGNYCGIAWESVTTAGSAALIKMLVV